MKIGITMRSDYIKSYNETRDQLDRRWFDLLSELSLTTVLIPNIGNKIESYIDALSLDGFILSGGNDICPDTLNIENKSLTNCSKERDLTELTICKYAFENNLPVLGVCRGMQLINVFFKGRLNFGIKGHTAVEHNINFVDDKFVNIYGNGKYRVNSYHSHFISKNVLGENLIAGSFSDDQVIESLRHTTEKFFGIMWHPERYDKFKKEDIKFIKNIFL